jgi:hypothetical protein
LRLAVSAAGAALVLSTLSGCFLFGSPSEERPLENTAKAAEPSPPPWAPERGRPRRSSDIELVFDSKTGLYLVLHNPGHYYDGKRYYRRLGERWQVSAHLDGPWTFVARDALPRGLAAGAEHAAPRAHTPLPANQGE